MEFHVVIPVLISFAISLVLGPIVIPFLRRLKMGQTERELGVQSHLKKNGTPTMGGVIFLIATTVTSLFYIRDYPMIIPVLFLTLGFGLIGFLDDYLKVVLKRSDGLLPWQKMALQIVVTAVFAFYLVNYSNVSLTMKIPFWSGHYLNLGWFAVPVLFFAVIGTVNGVNFTDGLDGLASSVTLIVAVFFTVVSLGMKSGVEPITCAVVGSLDRDLPILFQCISCQGIYGRHRFSGIGRICGWCGLCHADAAVYHPGRTDLPCGGIVCYAPGILFQGNTRKKNFQDGAYPPSF